MHTMVLECGRVVCVITGVHTSPRKIYAEKKTAENSRFSGVAIKGVSKDHGKCKNEVKHGFYAKRINPTNLGIFPRSFGIFPLQKWHF